jgi:glycosyltransferase 2 family protein
MASNKSENAGTNTGAKRSSARRLRAFAQVGIGVGALALVIAKSDAHALVAALKGTRISFLPLAVLATVATIWLMAYRWGLILESRGHRIRTGRLFGYYLVSNFFSNFVPGGAVTADVTRLICAARDVGDRPVVVSTLVYERLIGMFTLLMLGLGATLVGRVFRLDGTVLYIGEAFLAVAFAGSAMLMSRRISGRLGRLSRWLGNKLKLKNLGDAGARTLEAIADMRWHKRVALSTLVISVLMRIVWSLGAFSVARAMDLPISLPVMFAFISIIDLIRMLPISIGGLGVREWATVGLFANLSIAREQALMFSFLAFAPLMLTAIVGGLLYIFWAGVGRGAPKRVDDRLAPEAEQSQDARRVKVAVPR